MRASLNRIVKLSLSRQRHTVGVATKSCVMAFCTQFKIGEKLLVLANGKSSDLYEHIKKEQCAQPWTAGTWLGMVVGIFTIAVISTAIAGAMKSAARLVWHRVPYVDNIVPTRYFWAKIFGRRPIRPSALYNFEHRYSPAESTDSTIKVIRTYEIDRHGPSDHPRALQRPKVYPIDESYPK